MPSKRTIWMEGDCIAAVEFMQSDGCLTVKCSNGDTSDNWRRKKSSLFSAKEELSGRRVRTLSADEEISDFLCTVFKSGGYLFVVSFDMLETFSPLDQVSKCERQGSL
jgi:hypothetical protein